MSPLGLLVGYVGLGLIFLLLLPFTLAIALYDWLTLWRKGPAPSPFIPEHPDSFKAWADTMEQGRRLQEREDHDGR